MPKLGAEPIRREALVNAAIAEIARARSLDVTVAQIARRAEMSPALAHHYFGGKDRMLAATMRHILTLYGAEVRARLAEGGDRLAAIVNASFAPQNFGPETVRAWMTLYVHAQTAPDAARLLRVYHARLRSNLRHALRPAAAPEDLAETLAALIDGLFIRAALGGRIDGAGAERRVMQVARALA